MFRSSSLSLKPSDINYTCSAMGVTIEELDIQVSEGMKGGPEPHPRRLPKIQVFLHNGQYFTLNNTELHLCHLLERRGEIKTVRVNMVPKSKIPAEVIKLLLPEGERSENSSHTDTQESSTCDKCSDETGCTLDDINTESWVDTYKHMGSGEDSNSILSVCLNSDVESVDSIPDLDLSTSPESSTSASTESDLGEDIESFV
ncbi:uncharacterized protein [Magallana gigas]|uniref:uncharacterized protein n=1 Tax=Magallana gigas TaxID=29159 RepID=UPI00333EB96C